MRKYITHNTLSHLPPSTVCGDVSYRTVLNDRKRYSPFLQLCQDLAHEQLTCKKELQVLDDFVPRHAICLGRNRLFYAQENTTGLDPRNLDIVLGAAENMWKVKLGQPKKQTRIEWELEDAS